MVTNCHELKRIASDGKKYLTDMLNSDWIILLAKNFPNNNGSDFFRLVFIQWKEYWVTE